MRSDRAPALLLALLLTGCGAGGGADKQLDTVHSWTATVQLATAEHHAGALTSRFARQLGDEARQALAESRTTLAGPVSADTARRAAAALDSLTRAIGSLDAELTR